jgi:hypothetical protein
MTIEFDAHEINSCEFDSYHSHSSAGLQFIDFEEEDSRTPYFKSECRSVTSKKNGRP